MIDNNVSEVPQEHKSHNCIQLENGQYALYPNNRMRLYDLSITPQHPKTPDFKVSTIEYQVENGTEWGRLGDTDDYFWETPKDGNPDKSSEMVIKVDKSEEFKKSGKKLISEYDADKWLDKIEKNDERELFEMKRKREFLDECTKFRKGG